MSARLSMADYLPTGISFAYSKVRPSIMLFICPVCEIKHEKETSCISYEAAFCNKHYNLMQKRKSALAMRSPWDMPRNHEEDEDALNHVKWLRKLEGIE
jgi:hypothetical protein